MTNEWQARAGTGGALTATFIAAAVLTTVIGHESIVNWLSGDTAPAWVQAVFSVVAIWAAGATADRTLRKEHGRRAVEDLRARFALHMGAFQLIGGGYKIAEKIAAAAEKSPPSQARVAAGLKELEVLANALNQVDHLRFDSHVFIQGMLSTEAIVGSLADSIDYAFKKNNSFDGMGAGGWAEVASMSRAAMHEVTNITDGLFPIVKGLEDVVSEHP